MWKVLRFMQRISCHLSTMAINWPFKNVQEPIELYIGGDYCTDLMSNFVEISSYLSRLESLTLKMYYILKLKQLKLSLRMAEGDCLLIFTLLMEACPFLYKFILEVSYTKYTSERKWQIVKGWPHQNLKEVEFIGFVGQMMDNEPAMYLIKSARHPCDMGTLWESMETERKVAKNHANKFRTKLHVGAALVIL
ncbi:uncharacterized protein LOC132303874 [Cornus florida]|uniref:uncharacterized protein LOC132303874 n=1 Tax=Cornus florida TaxID=4283 RepID=UPI00289F536F|nr:uncharacterized protein LOC132303874 [Cornus florida]